MSTNLPKVLVAMSGGVDSTGAVLMLKNQGYEVAGATYILTENMKEASKRASKVCERIGIKHFEIDYVKLFEEKVKDYFAKCYLDGRTPNPCVMCNKEIKFKVFIEFAKENGFDKVATGHYCAIKEDENGYHLISGNSNKDQTYFLSRIDKEALSYAVFPIGKFDKSEVRRLVLGTDEETSKKKDSQDICFVPDGDYVSVLNEIVDKKDLVKANSEGEFILEDSGKVIAKHKGYINYTIGQRKGLNVAYTEPLFVRRIDSEENKVYLTSGDKLWGISIKCRFLNILNEYSYQKALNENSLEAKVRFSKGKTKVKKIEQEDDDLIITFEEPVRAATPGQTIAFYSNEECVGGAEIISNDFDK